MSAVDFEFKLNQSEPSWTATVEESDFIKIIFSISDDWADSKTFGCLDVQISICMFLHPSDILALALRKVCRTSEVAHISEVLFSKTCKAPQRSTRQNEVWVVALHRVSLVKILFTFQVFPCPTWVTWNLKSLRWPCLDGLNSVTRSRNNISMILVQYCVHGQLELSKVHLPPGSIRILHRAR